MGGARASPRLFRLLVDLVVGFPCNQLKSWSLLEGDLMVYGVSTFLADPKTDRPTEGRRASARPESWLSAGKSRKWIGDLRSGFGIYGLLPFG